MKACAIAVLNFRFAGQPPRRTHQGGVQYRKDWRAKGGVRVYIDAAHCAEAWQIRDAIRRQLPEGWTPLGDPVELSVYLVYPERKIDNLPGDALIPHTERPDADNLVKSILDAATRAGVWLDDAQVFDLRVRKFRGRVPRWTADAKFGGYGFLAGRRMPLGELMAAIRELRRLARKQKPAGDDRQGTLFGSEAAQ